MRQNGKSSGVATRDPDRTRRRILAAALAEFADKGFAGARVDAIARRARGNKRMLYHYFGNKEALFQKALDRYAAGPTAFVRDAVTEPTAHAVAERIMLGVVDRATIGVP